MTLACGSPSKPAAVEDDQTDDFGSGGGGPEFLVRGAPGPSCERSAAAVGVHEDDVRQARPRLCVRETQADRLEACGNERTRL